jgi:sulfhydrogenase subunit alpha
VTERTLAVDYLARVEGEGALRARINGDRVEEIELKIFEPPRFFEAFLAGRRFDEAPDITSRICGICPVAYQMSACHALEHALGVRVEGALRDLRRLLYCGEWIESHALHIYLLHAPDFLGFPDAVQLSRSHPEIVRQGLELKRIGNELMSTLGGREIHPINVRVGGFYRVPEPGELRALLPSLERALGLAEATARFAAGLEFPDVREEYEFVALRGPGEYPLNEGRLVSSAGIDVPAEEFERVFEERQVPYSNALQCVRHDTGNSYLVGPLARYALNRERLGPRALGLAKELGLPPIERNPFRSIVIRSLEVVFACEEALRIVQEYRRPDAPAVSLPAIPSAVSGAAITEAPRGILYHRYELDPGGNIRTARIVPPTSQNQRRIEDDLRHLIERSLDLDDAALTGVCERAIRNHDPCISCATHFLRLDLRRE